MGHLFLPKKSLFMASLIFIVILCFYSGAAQDQFQEQSLAKALSCFDNNLIYVACDQLYRLNPSGNINVPPEATDFFCSGPCLAETQLVLNCIDNMLSDFLFYNKASVQQIRYALIAGCNFAKERGIFNLGDHIGGEISTACNLTIWIRSHLFFVLVAAAINLL
ncbi:uncharacterized protein LOC114728158 [Neltuma alba]|uniref:uncharacterized protein LOC114728158 n=1 Tax=Neltuma alba TaxID=207710 RepID=UPI0010A3DB10|nr:uncharacterized protein LOC114728158 [Prosopis alba]